MYINSELEQIEKVLAASLSVLKTGGRLNGYQLSFTGRSLSKTIYEKAFASEKSATWIANQ